MKKILSTILVFVLLSYAGQALAAPALVQKKKVYSTAALTFDSNNTAGNLIVAVLGGGNSSEIPCANNASITDSNGNIYTQAVYRSHRASNSFMFYAKNINAGANTVTATFSGSPCTDHGWQVAEFSGVDTVSPFMASTTGGGTGFHPNASSTTSTGSGILIAHYSDERGGCTPSAGAGFTIIDTNAGHCDSWEYQVVSAGVYTPTFTAGSSEYAVTAAIFSAAGNPTTNSTPRLYLRNGILKIVNAFLKIK